MEDIYQVLVVEDDEVVRLLTVDALNALGYSAAGVSLGQQALDLLAQLPSLKLLMTDLGLPDMGGLQLAERVAQQRPDLKVLLASGYIQNGHIHQPQHIPTAHSFAVISKPFNLEQLRGEVAKLIQK